MLYNLSEIRGEVHHISLVGDRTLLALDRNKLPLPPLYSRYFMWGFPDRSARVASVEADKVRKEEGEEGGGRGRGGGGREKRKGKEEGGRGGGGRGGGGREGGRREGRREG